MTTDLWCLVLNALWGFVLVMIEIAGKTRAGGPAWNAGNRDAPPKLPVWVERAGRALGNHKENFPFFLTAVIVVHLAGRDDATSAAAAIAYVVARMLHGVIYIAGITYVRSLVWTVGLLAIFAILSRLL
jgi:uncharacterized MAPEG superfamily protein